MVTFEPALTVGKAFTVTFAVTKQPVGSVYDITELPTATPVTIPEADTIVAFPLLLVQVPPDERSLIVIVDPKQTRPPALFIAAGKGFTDTVTEEVFEHPFRLVRVTVYVVVLAGVAVTVAPVVADSPVAGDHVKVPPPPVALKVVEEPLQMVTFEPALTAGNGLTVTLIVINTVFAPSVACMVNPSVPLYPPVGV